MFLVSFSAWLCHRVLYGPRPYVALVHNDICSPGMLAAYLRQRIAERKVGSNHGSHGVEKSLARTVTLQQLYQSDPNYNRIQYDVD